MNLTFKIENIYDGFKIFICNQEGLSEYISKNSLFNFINLNPIIVINKFNEESIVKLVKNSIDNIDSDCTESEIIKKLSIIFDYEYATFIPNWFSKEQILILNKK